MCSINDHEAILHRPLPHGVRPRASIHEFGAEPCDICGARVEDHAALTVSWDRSGPASRTRSASFTR
jgi:hypothetical protein